MALTLDTEWRKVLFDPYSFTYKKVVSDNITVDIPFTPPVEPPEPPGPYTATPYVNGDDANLLNPVDLAEDTVPNFIPGVTMSEEEECRYFLGNHEWMWERFRNDIWREEGNNTFKVRGKAVGDTYGALKIFTNGDDWYAFRGAPSIDDGDEGVWGDYVDDRFRTQNGFKRIFLDKVAGGDMLGGWFGYYYHTHAIRNALGFYFNPEGGSPTATLHTTGTSGDLDNPDDEFSMGSQAGKPYNTFVHMAAAGVYDETEVNWAVFLTVGNWTWQCHETGNWTQVSGNDSGDTYGIIKMQPRMYWDQFAESDTNGQKQNYFPKYAYFDTLGGFYRYYYNETVWRYAFDGETDDIIHTIEGHTYKGSISLANLVITWDGETGPAGSATPDIPLGGSWETSNNNLEISTNHSIYTDGNVGDNDELVVRWDGMVGPAGQGDGVEEWEHCEEDTPFLPVEPPLNDLELWIDFSDLSTITLDGSGRISVINDKSGNGRNFSNGTAVYRPTSSFDAELELFIADFDGDNDRLYNGYDEIHDNTNGFDVFAAGRSENGLNIHTAKWRYSTGNRQWRLVNNSFYITDLGGSASESKAAFGYHTVSEGGTTTADAIWSLKNGRWKPGQRTSFFANGVEQARATDPVASIYNGNDRLRIGGEGLSIRLWDGPQGEIRIYNRYLTGAERIWVEIYYQDKWSLPNKGLDYAARIGVWEI